MKIINKLSVSVFALLVSGTVLASAVNSATIPLPIQGSGMIGPHEIINLSLKPIPKSDNATFAPYDIYCTIENDAYKLSKDSLIMQLSWSSSGIGSLWGVTVNGISSGPNANLSIKDAMNDYLATRVARLDDTAYLSFKNLDNEYTVQLRSCYAKPNVI